MVDILQLWDAHRHALQGCTRFPRLGVCGMDAESAHNVKGSGSAHVYIVTGHQARPGRAGKHGWWVVWIQLCAGKTSVA